MYEVFETLLEKHGVTPYRVAKETGVTQTALSNWKTGKSVPNAKTLQKIADYFGVSIDYIMTGKEEWQPKLTEEKAALVARITKDSELLITIEEYYSLSEAMKQFVRNMVHDLTVRDIED